METTTLGTIFGEDANRGLLLCTDESREQTADIIRHAACAAADGRRGADTGRRLRVQHSLQRMLRRVRVRAPFAKRLAGKFLTDRPEARRSFDHLLSMIRASACLHQRQRPGGGRSLQHGDEIEAMVADYAIARELLMGPLARSLGRQLRPRVVEFAKWLFECFECRRFTVPQLLRADRSPPRSTAHDLVKELVEHGVVAEVDRVANTILYSISKGVDVARLQDRVVWLPEIDGSSSRPDQLPVCPLVLVSTPDPRTMSVSA